MKPVAVFLRVPSAIAARVTAVIIAENKTSGGEPGLLCAGKPSLPQYFARAGEREVERVERLRGHRPRVEEPEAPERATGEGVVHAPFDISDELATRTMKAIARLNGIRGESGADPICQRAGKPSLPPFFYRAGLIELARDEVSIKTSRSGARRSTRKRERTATVRELLSTGPSTISGLVSAGLRQREAHNTISGMMTTGEVVVLRHMEISRRGKPKTPVYALAKGTERVGA